MSDLTVHDKALQVQAAARDLHVRAQGEAEARRVAGRVAAVRQALANMEQQVKVAHLLRERTGHRVDLTRVTNGLPELSRRAAGGLPDDGDFTRAKRKLERSAKDLAADIQMAWRSWAQGQLDARPLQRIAMLYRDEQHQAQSLVKQLERLLKVADVKDDTIRTFGLQAAALDELLTHAPDFPDELAQLMQQIATDSMTLGDLSDHDVALLRLHKQAEQIRLSRKVD